VNKVLRLNRRLFLKLLEDTVVADVEAAVDLLLPSAVAENVCVVVSGLLLKDSLRSLKNQQVHDISTV
jgi:hypothetical protein